MTVPVIKPFDISSMATEAMSEEEAFKIEMAHGMKVMMSKDAVEGPKAFMEKRPAVFKGE